jgi:uncharacterized membrane protein
MNWFFWATISALLSAIAAVTQKRVLDKLKPLELSFILSALILAGSLAFLPGCDFGAIGLPAFALLLGKSILGGLGFLLVMSALASGEISSVLPLLGMTPAVAAILSFLITGETLAPVEWAAVGAMTAGAIIVEAGTIPVRRSTGTRFDKSHLYVALALVVFGISSVGDRILVSGQKIDPRIVLVYQHLVYFLLFGGVLLAGKSRLSDVIRGGRGQILLLIGIAAVTIGYRFTQLEATRLAPVALVLAVKRTSILYASFFGGKIFADRRLGIRIAGACLIIAAGFILLRNVG